jgi:hypothetical protein
MADQKVEKGCLGIQGIGHQQLEGSRVSLQHALQQAHGCGYFIFAGKLCFHIEQQVDLLAAQHQHYLAMVKLDPLSLRRVDGSLQTS